MVEEGVQHRRGRNRRRGRGGAARGLSLPAWRTQAVARAHKGRRRDRRAPPRAARDLAPLRLAHSGDDWRRVDGGEAAVHHPSIPLHQQRRGVTPPRALRAGGIRPPERARRGDRKLVDDEDGIGVRPSVSRESEGAIVPARRLAHVLVLRELARAVRVERVVRRTARRLGNVRGGDADVDSDGSHTAQRGGRREDIRGSSLMNTGRKGGRGRRGLDDGRRVADAGEGGEVIADPVMTDGPLTLRAQKRVIAELARRKLGTTLSTRALPDVVGNRNAQP